MNRLLLFGLLLCALIPIGYSLSCGDVVSKDSELNQSLRCSGTALEFENDVSFSCNNYSIKGNGQNLGLYIYGSDNVSITNCNIENFNVGISLRPKTYYDGGFVTTQPRNTEITNSSIKNSTTGIYLRESYSSKITGVDFINNNKGIYVNKGEGLIYDNSFFSSDFIISTTKGVESCYNSTGNTYSNSTGPTCSCTPPSSGMIINSDVRLCSGTYTISQPFFMKSDTHLDCNNAQISGNSKGILLRGASNTTISNCILENFSTALDYTLAFNTKVSNPSSNNYVVNSTLYNVDKGIVMGESTNSQFLGVDTIVSTYINASSYAIKNTPNKQLNGHSNWIYRDIKNLSKIAYPKRIDEQSFFTNTPNTTIVTQNFSFISPYLQFSLYHKNNNSLNLVENSPFLTHRGIIGDNLLSLNSTNYFFNTKKKEFTIITIDSNGEINTHKNHEDKPTISNETHSFSVILNNSKQQFSYTHYFSSNTSQNKSIILSNGLWGSFETWEDYIEKFVEKGYEVYVIALTGEFLECDSCYNYHYEDLKNTILPKYLEEISKDSQKSLFYIGHSNGARTFLDADIQLNTTLSSAILLGTPGGFFDSTPTSLAIEYFDKKIESTISTRTHISLRSLILNSIIDSSRFSSLLSLLPFSSATTISTNLYSFYHNIITQTGDIPSQENMSLLFIEGKLPKIGDGVVAHYDHSLIVNSSKGNIIHKQIPLSHTQLTNHPKVFSEIITYIEKEEFK